MVRARLTAMVTLSVAIILVVFGVGVYKFAEGNLTRTMDRELHRRATAIENVWTSVGPRVVSDPKELGKRGLLARQPVKVRRALFSQAFLLPKFFKEGRTSLFEGRTPWDGEAVDRAWRGERVLRTVRQGAESFRVLTVPLYIEGRPKGVVQLAASLGDAQAEQARLSSALYAMVPVMVVATVLLSVLLTRFALLPVGRIARAADRIQAKNLSERLPVHGKDEIANLSAVFNSVLDRLESAFEAQRRFTSDASHELKSPLAAIKLKAEIATLRRRSPEEYEESLRQIGRNVDGMSQLVTDMLLLAQSDEGGLAIERKATRLADLVDDVLSEISEGGSEISVDVPEALNVSVDRTMFGRVLRNLLENAQRHTPAEGKVVVRAEGVREGVRIEVADDGEGIPESALPYVFDRFFKVDRARDRSRRGTGLGLAICRSVVEAHGGSISIRSQLGKGTTFRIEIPT